MDVDAIHTVKSTVYESLRAGKRIRKHLSKKTLSQEFLKLIERYIPVIIEIQINKSGSMKKLYDIMIK